MTDSTTNSGLWDSIVDKILQISRTSEYEQSRIEANKNIQITRDLVDSNFEKYISKLSYESPATYASKPRTYTHIVRKFLQEFTTSLSQPDLSFISTQYPDETTKYGDWVEENLGRSKLSTITEIAGTSAVKVIWDGEGLPPKYSIWSRENIIPYVDDETGELIGIGIDHAGDMSISSGGMSSKMEIWTPTLIRKYEKNILISEHPNPYSPHLPFVIFRSAESPDEWWGDSDIQHYSQINITLNNLLTQWSSGFMDQVTLGRITIASDSDSGVIDDELSNKDNLNWSYSKILQLPENSRVEHINVEGSMLDHLNALNNLILSQYNEGNIVLPETIAAAESGYSLLVRTLPYQKFIRVKQGLYGKSLSRLTKLTGMVSSWSGSYESGMQLDPEWKVKTHWDNSFAFPVDQKEVVEKDRVLIEKVKFLLERGTLTPEEARDLLEVKPKSEEALEK